MWLTYLQVFLVGGFICFLGQILILKTKVTSAIMGIFSGGLASTATGIGAAVFFSFIFALIFSSHTKKS